jgi:hypothetical protein
MAVLTGAGVIAAIETGAELVKNIQTMLSIIPKAADELTDKHRWMTLTVRNETQFPIIYTGGHYWGSGRFWDTPEDVKPFSSETFSVCSKDGSIATGATGGVRYQLRMPMEEGGYQNLDVAIGFARPELGARKCSAIYSSDPEAAYNAASSDGSAHTSREFTGTNANGDEVTINFRTVATPGEGSTVKITEQIVAVKK